MAVGINGPVIRPSNNESDLDKLAKLLNIGANGYGIYDAMGRRALANEQAAREKTVFDQKQEYQAKMQDVNSPLYKAAQGAYAQAGVKVDPSVSMYDAKQLYGDAGELLKAKLSAQAKQAANPLEGLLAQERLDKMMREKKDEAFKKTPEGKLQGLSSGDKARYDNVIMGLGAVKGMSDALGAGDWTVHPIGDNNFTLSQKQWEEAIGRMQSGGAIGVQEGEKFRKLAPGALDSAEIRNKKLQEAQNLMVQRLKTMGFDANQAQQLGIDPSMFAAVGNQQVLKTGKGKVNGADVFNAPQANAAQPQTIIQNGHTYTLNPKTGKYE